MVMSHEKQQAGTKKEDTFKSFDFCSRGERIRPSEVHAMNHE